MKNNFMELPRFDAVAELVERDLRLDVIAN